MLFKDRAKLAREYYEWLQVHREAKDCALTVIGFIDGKGFLKNNADEITERNK